MDKIQQTDSINDLARRYLMDQRVQIDRLIAQIDGAASRVEGTTGTSGDTKPAGRRVMSAEARKRISNMMKKRWAARKAEAAKPKRKKATKRARPARRATDQTQAATPPSA